MRICSQFFIELQKFIDNNSNLIDSDVSLILSFIALLSFSFFLCDFSAILGQSCLEALHKSRRVEPLF